MVASESLDERLFQRGTLRIGFPNSSVLSHLTPAPRLAQYAHSNSIQLDNMNAQDRNWKSQGNHGHRRRLCHALVASSWTYRRFLRCRDHLIEASPIWLILVYAQEPFHSAAYWRLHQMLLRLTNSSGGFKMLTP